MEANIEEKFHTVGVFYPTGREEIFLSLQGNEPIAHQRLFTLLLTCKYVADWYPSSPFLSNTEPTLQELTLSVPTLMI